MKMLHTLCETFCLCKQTEEAVGSEGVGLKEKSIRLGEVFAEMLELGVEDTYNVLIQVLVGSSIYIRMIVNIFVMV